jgi:hypothetical protein
LSLTWSNLLKRLSTEFFIWLIELLISSISIQVCQGCHIFIEFPFHISHCLSYSIQLFIYILFEIISCLFVFSLNLLKCLHVIFDFIDHSYHHCIEFIVWDFIHFTIPQALYCGIVDFGDVMAPCGSFTVSIVLFYQPSMLMFPLQNGGW